MFFFFDFFFERTRPAASMRPPASFTSILVTEDKITVSTVLTGEGRKDKECPIMKVYEGKYAIAATLAGCPIVEDRRYTGREKPIYPTVIVEQRITDRRLGYGRSDVRSQQRARRVYFS